MALVRRLVHCTRPQLARSFITLPDLSSLSPFSGQDGNNQGSQVYHERKVFPYSQRQLYELVADASSYPRFLPFCTNARVLSKKPHPSDAGHLNMDVELTVGFLNFTESYISKVTLRPYESAVAASSTPVFKTLDTIWRFQPAPPQSPPPGSRISSSTTSTAAGPTLVTLDLKFAFASPVHAAVSASVFGQVSKMMVQAFEQRCQEIYGLDET
ncbi:dehydrase and lipid transport-domain-containing protein [Epithele typhae]|uniref:dehydrase and lipid transport-domain-containing protein n=1 Tax=Epithele typhae TaxID=378194 RepID=UPI0020076BA0|nr:dehydrase and lipid transport-domain-containing protein [Epithele typhae]KAH9943152.1 dehydrase and lipid transport-domain-containing protein [Epithele typhae]